MKEVFKSLINPFEKIAGWKALAWGLAGMALSIALCIMTGYHYHGLLHYGPASNGAWWTYLVEHIVVWLIPAILFYAGGLMFSHSHIRAIDVLGTTLFAQLPLILSTLITAVPTMQELANIKPDSTVEGMMEQLQGINLTVIIICALLLAIVVALMIIWLFRAVKISCNLKGWRLWAVYLTAILIGDVITRMIIGTMHA